MNVLKDKSSGIGNGFADKQNVLGQLLPKGLVLDKLSYKPFQAV